MSVYSTDSLEEPSQPAPKYLSSTGNDTIGHDTRSNETALRGNGVRRRVPGGRNAIIANSGLAIVSPCKNGDEKEGGGTRSNDRSSKRSSGGQKLGCSLARLADTGEKKRANKKLGSLLLSRIQPGRKERSYLEVYRRRFEAPSCDRREENPPGGWSTEEEEKVEERDCSPMISGWENRSELSFYHRLIEQRSTSPTVRSIEVRQGRPASKHSGFNRDKSERRLLGYKPYTVEEYRALAVPTRADRSLGPDLVEIQAKREWLMRRRSYGNFVSARNRQQVLIQTQRLKSRRDAAKECFLPPLQDRGANAKGADDPSISAVVGVGGAMSSDSDKRSCEHSNNPSWLGALAGKSKNFDKASSLCSPLNSRTTIVEDVYPEDLRERRHPYEKDLRDRVPTRMSLCYARNGCFATVFDAIKNGYA